MKILQINNVYPDKSTGKITSDIHHVLLQMGDESYVLYGRGASVKEKNVMKVCSELYAKYNVVCAAVSGIPYGGCYLSTYKIIRLIKRIKPDVVHLQCINEHFVNIYRLIQWLKQHQIPTVITLHAEFMYTANCGHAYECEKWKTGCGHCSRFREADRSLFWDRTHRSFLLMKRSFKNFDQFLRIVSVSPWLQERAVLSPVFAGKKHSVILNGVNTDIFHFSGNCEKEKSRKIVLHVTALFRDEEDDPKGGGYILKLAERMKEENVLFLIAGKSELTSNMALSQNVVLLGNVRDQNQLAAYYNKADLTVIASRRETYSMVCAESLCCGTPVVGFKAGAPETISIPDYSEFVEYGDLDSLQKCIEKWLNYKGVSNKQKISQQAIEKYNRVRMVERYKEIYNELLSERTNHRQQKERT